MPSYVIVHWTGCQYTKLYSGQVMNQYSGQVMNPYIGPDVNIGNCTVVRMQTYETVQRSYYQVVKPQ